jgi:hypothetical protein
MARTTEQWIELLKSRCKAEGVECYLSDAELCGWCGGVNSDDEEDDVFAALCETIDPAGTEAFHAEKQEEWDALTKQEIMFI